jgi:DNA-binding beta-propeller fold protein YncE
MNAWGIAIDAAGNLWVVNGLTNPEVLAPGTVTELSPGGTILGTYQAGTDALDIAIDGCGNVWVTNSGASTVTQIAGATACQGAL